MNTGRVFLHLGLAKTGTSWFQKKLFPLLDLDYMHCSHYEVLNKTKRQQKDLLLSFEGFSGTIPMNDRFVNAYRLHKLFPNAFVFLMFRAPNRYLRSLYSQHIKNGGIMSQGEFNCLCYDHPYFMNWELYENYLVRLWGKQQVHIRWFEDFCHNPQVFVHDLCRWMHQNVPEDIDYHPVNSGLTDHQIVVWRRWNHRFRSRWNKKSLLPKWLNPCFIMKNMEWYYE